MNNKNITYFKGNRYGVGDIFIYCYNNVDHTFMVSSTVAPKWEICEFFNSIEDISDYIKSGFLSVISEEEAFAEIL